jgi:hypothetical protein
MTYLEIQLMQHQEKLTYKLWNFSQSEFTTQPKKSFLINLLKIILTHFCDIRQRRGVRGAKYSFVNSNRLQQKLMIWK